jgi:hypothetical protein
MQLLLNTEMEQKDNNNFIREKRVKYTPFPLMEKMLNTFATNPLQKL